MFQILSTGVEMFTEPMIRVSKFSQKNSKPNTAWKVLVFGAFLIRIFSHLDWVWRDTEYDGGPCHMKPVHWFPLLIEGLVSLDRDLLHEWVQGSQENFEIIIVSIVNTTKFSCKSPEVFYEKKPFFKISQYSQENTCDTCVQVFFLMKLQTKKRLQHRCFLWILQNF